MGTNEGKDQHGSGFGGWKLPPVDLVDAQLPEIEITSLLGRGAMGAVYAGVQTEIGREVAVKVLPPEVAADGRSTERFRREAQVLGELVHPGIVGLYDFGDLDLDPAHGQSPGSPYIVMEHVDGADLANRLLAQGPLSPEEAVALLSQTCDALSHAHQKGYVHRDIKPANLFVTSEGQVKVGDFGVAKLVEANVNPREAAKLTMTGYAMGTANYAAPETLRKGHPIDHRADLYGLAVTLYELLVGTVPRGVFPPPSEVRAEISPAFDALITRGMQQDPAARHSSALEFKKELQEALVAPLEGPDLSTAKAQAGWMRRPLLLTLAVVAVAAAGVAGTAMFLPDDSADDERAGASRAVDSSPWSNSLGMKFTPVPIANGPTSGREILFSIWETRRMDYRTFVEENSVPWNSEDWELDGFAETEFHPAVMLNWEDAVQFCEWLTRRERADGTIGARDVYRLPSDHEWSCAIGIGDMEDVEQSPKTREELGTAVYPWGTEFPPPVDLAGNVMGEETRETRTAAMSRHAKDVIHGYRDPFARTAPVGSFPAGLHGLHDMSGNVREWCFDNMKEGATYRVLRGSSYRTNHERTLKSSARKGAAPTDRTVSSRGFRVVLERGAEE